MKNPYEKIVHKGDKINERGGVSALCFSKPRAIDPTKASYVFAPENDFAVSCPKCLKIMAEKKS